MSRTSSNYPFRATIGLFVLTPLFCCAAVSQANETNYSRTLQCTTWIITSSAEHTTSTGTGVLVDTDRRLVLTNAHVVGDSRSALVFFPVVGEGIPKVKRSYYLDNAVELGLTGKVVAIDRKRDLAIIQLPTLPEHVRAIDLAGASTTAGSRVNMIGNPGDSDVLWAFTSGTVRQVYDKQFNSDHGEHDFKVVETQTPIKPGDSGGPVVDAEGKLVGIAQSFSPHMSQVSYSVDISEIKSFLESPWKPAPLATKDVLDKADIQHVTHSTGHYQVEQPVPSGATQSVFIAKDTEFFKRADVRRIWSLAFTSKEPPSADLMMRLMRQSSATKIGGWAIERSSEGDFMLLYVAKLDATAPEEALRATIDYVARIASEMRGELEPQPKGESSSDTLAAWLAK